MVASQESITAKLCTFARAYHSSFDREKIFDDYLAYDLMGIEGYRQMGQLIENKFDTSDLSDDPTFKRELILKRLNKYISPIPLSRIAFTEGELERFAKQHEKCQYVICGAGMDSFAFRNTNKNIEIFEIDHPDTQAYKKERIKELEWNIPDNLHFTEVDFSKDDMIFKLLSEGFDRDIPTFFAIPGVTYYITLPVFRQTLQKIRLISAEGSKVAFDFPDDSTFCAGCPKRVKRLSLITEGLGEPMLHGFAVEEVRKVLAKTGFEVEEHLDPQSIQERFFENRSDEQTACENIHFILARKSTNSI